MTHLCESCRNGRFPSVGGTLCLRVLKLERPTIRALAKGAIMGACDLYEPGKSKRILWKHCPNCGYASAKAK